MTEPITTVDLADELNDLTISATGNKVCEEGACLTKLPNELLHQIIGYLTTAEPINAAHGFGSNTLGIYNDMKLNLARRQARTGRMRILLDVALTCKRLAPVAQEALFASVSVPQPRQPLAADSRHHSPLTRFLYTAVNRPELASKTKDLSMLIWKGKAADQDKLRDMDKGVCHCDQCIPTFIAALHHLNLSHAEKSQWLVDLQHPTEAMICSLIITTLPNVKSVALYARIYPGHAGTEDTSPPAKPTDRYIHQARRIHPLSDLAEITCLAQGLSVTDIQTLSLSTNLNGLHRAKLPSLAALSLDYSVSNPFVTVGKGSFVNVTTLKLRADAPFDFGVDATACASKLEILYKGLPSLRRVEYESAKALALCSIPPQARTMIMHGATKYVLHYTFPKVFCLQIKGCCTIRSLELYWPDSEDMYTR